MATSRYYYYWMHLSVFMCLEVASWCPAFPGSALSLPHFPHLFLSQIALVTSDTSHNVCYHPQNKWIFDFVKWCSQDEVWSRDIKFDPVLIWVWQQMSPRQKQMTRRYRASLPQQMKQHNAPAAPNDKYAPCRLLTMGYFLSHMDSKSFIDRLFCIILFIFMDGNFML